MTKRILKLLGLTVLLALAVAMTLENPLLGSMLLPLFGAVTVTNVLVDNNKRIDDIEATADADTTATIAHGFGATPLEVFITAIVQATAAISLWAATTIDATNVVLTKGTGVGSGGAGAQIRVITKRRGTP